MASMENQNQSLSDDEPSLDPSDFIASQQRRAQARVVSSLDDDPEQAAESIRLSEATGAPAPVIHGNFENFQKQNKARLASELLRNNQYLAQFADSHPMAAKVAADDWGNLDKVSETLHKQGFTGLSEAGVLPSDESMPSVMGAAAKGFSENFNLEGMNEEHKKLAETLAGIPALQNIFIQQGILAAGDVLQGSMALFSGVIGGGSEAIAQTARNLGMNEAESARLTRDLIAMAQVGLAGQAGLYGVVHPEIVSEIGKWAEVYKEAKPFIDSGEVPPMGIHPEIDKVHIEQSKRDLAWLDDAFKDSQASTTRERAPDLYADFVRSHTDGTINVSAEAVRKLYGGKPITPEDGILGWAPRLAEQLALADPGGGHVEIPLADWLAKVDPEVNKVLHDDIKLRRNGVTKNEAEKLSEIEKVLKDAQEEGPQAAEQVEPTITDGLRKAAALEGLPAPKGWDIAEPGFQPISIIPDFAEKGGRFGTKENNAPVIASFSYKEALANLDTSGLTGVPKVLAEFFGDRLEKAIGDVPVRVVAHADVQELLKDTSAKRGRTSSIPAFYDPRVHEIVIADDVANGQHGAEITSRILLHEGIHAFTSRRIARDPELRGHIKLMMEEVTDLFDQIDPEAIKQFYYAFQNEHEFMAEAMSQPSFQKVLALTPMSEALAHKMGLDQGKRTVWEAVRDIVKNLVEKLVGIRPSETILDGIFQLGKVFEERGVPPVDSLKARAGRVLAPPTEPELPQAGTTRMEDRDPFKGAMLGFTAAQTKRIMDLIEKRHTEDVEAATKLALEEQKLRESKEWKDNRKAVRDEVAKDIGDRPVVALDQFLSAGKHGLDKDSLTPEQAAKLPKNYIRAEGVNPDELAGFFGYSSGADMVDRLSAYTEARKAAGMSAKDYLTRVIDQETERQMELRYKPAEDLLEEAKDRIASETQLDILHETTLALAQKARLEFSIDKASFTGSVKNAMGKLSLAEIDSKKYLADAGRAGRAMQEAYTRQDWTEAAKNSQHQYTSMVMYQEALKVAKERGRFDKVAKTMSAREVPAMVPDYTNWVHDILLRIGKPVKRSLQDLQDAIGRTEHKELGEFVEYKEGHDLREVPVADFLMDGKDFRKEYGQLSLDEFRAINDSIKTLIKNGKNERTIEKAGEAADLAEVKAKMVEQLKSFAEKHYDAEGNRWLGPIPPAPARIIRTFLANHLQIESLLNRWDRGDYKGVFTQYVMRDLADAANNQSAIERRYLKMLVDIKDDVNLKEQIPNQIWRNPDNDGLMILTRKNLRAMLLNAGNEENLAKLAKGYKIKPEIARAWLHKFATKEDWEWVGKIGKIFAELKKESDVMYRGLSGVEPESIPTPPIQTPHGEMPGFYYPLIKHPFFEGTKKQIGTDPLEGPGYVRATVPAGYTKKRTGAVYPLALDLDMMPVQMRQMIHDIAMRPSVINASKIFYDKEVRSAIARHYGQEYRELLVPYIRDVANAGNFRSDAQKVFANWSEFMRQNAITTLIGLNPGTVMKHGPTALVQSVKEVGIKDFSKELTGLMSTYPQTGESNWAFAMRESQELQRRTRHYNETLGGAQEKVLGEENMRDTIIKYASAPVAMSDLLSAVPTWLAAYKAEMAKNGGVVGDATSFADRAVRRAHGSSVITNRSGVMRQGPLMSWMTSVYGFFNHIMNRQYEMMWQAKDALQEGNAIGFGKVAAKQAAPLTAALFAYVLLPALIEELVSPLPDDKNKPEGFAKKAAKGLTFSLSASWIGLRDITSAILYGRDPAVGLLSTTYRTMSDVARDLGKDRPMAKEKAGNIIAHGATLLGMTTGMMNAQVGRMGKFGYNVYEGVEKPKGPWGWMTGLRYGTTKGHSQTFEEYQKHLKGAH